MASIGPFKLTSAPGWRDLLLSHFDSQELMFIFETPATGPLAHLCMPGNHWVTGVVTISRHPEGDTNLWDVEGPVHRIESVYEKLALKPKRFRAKFSSHTRHGLIELFD